MRAVNLLPRDAERTRSRGERLPLAVAAGGIATVTALFALLVLSASGAADERRAELALTEAAIEAVPAPERPSPASSLVAQERADRVAALSTALSSRIAVDRMLRELSYVLPADAWLTGLIANAPEGTDTSAASPGSAAGSAGVAGVTIQGATFSHDAVARVLARLALLPTLDNVRLTASARIQPSASEGAEQTKTTKKKKAVVTFTIEADLRTGGRS
jgi:Tfp pilus assembly protein PilN